MQFPVGLAVFGLAHSAQAQAQTEPAAEGLNLFAQSNSSFVTLWQVIESGGWVMLPLAVLSFIATILVLVYFFTLRRGAVVTDDFMETAESLIKKGDYLALIAIANRHRESVARVVQKTLDFAINNPEADFKHLREVAEAEGTRQAGVLSHRISYLADVGMIAPMVGLFGTVVGMIQSFSVLASDIAASRPMMLAEGVSVALVSTATGLVIGIPALAFHAYFRGRVQSLIADLEAASTHLFSLVSLTYQSSRSIRRSAAIEADSGAGDAAQ